MKKNSMGLNKYEYAVYLRDQASIALESAHERSDTDPKYAADLHDLSSECTRAARISELTQD